MPPAAMYNAIASERMWSCSSAQMTERLDEMVNQILRRPPPVASSLSAGDIIWLSLFGGLAFAIGVFVGTRRRIV